MKIRDKKFLTSDELTYVLNAVQMATDEFSKEILKVALVAQIVIDDVDWNAVDENGNAIYETCNDIYDAVMAEEAVNEDFKLRYDVVNFWQIDDILDRETRVDKVIANFLNELGAKIDEYAKTVDLGQLKGLLNELKNLEVENEEAK